MLRKTLLKKSINNVETTLNKHTVSPLFYISHILFVFLISLIGIQNTSILTDKFFRNNFGTKTDINIRLQYNHTHDDIFF